VRFVPCRLPGPPTATATPAGHLLVRMRRRRMFSGRCTCSMRNDGSKALSQGRLDVAETDIAASPGPNSSRSLSVGLSVAEEIQAPVLEIDPVGPVIGDEMEAHEKSVPWRCLELQSRRGDSRSRGEDRRLPGSRSPSRSLAAARNEAPARPCPLIVAHVVPHDSPQTAESRQVSPVF
jgi:hypothetical protein